MKVALRKKKLKNGLLSLYLDIYKGITYIDGKPKDVRDYEFLGIYIYDNPKNAAEREHNKEKMIIAETIRARRELELLSGKYQVPLRQKQFTDFISYARSYADKKKKNYRNNFYSLITHLTNFIGSDKIPFKEINQELIKRFIEYLQAKNLHPNTINTYLTALNTILNNAVNDGHLPSNPMFKIERPKTIPAKREFLTVDEVRQLARTECKDELIKRMFLFSCLTGLRYSDIIRIRWADIQTTNEGTRLFIRQQKTGDVEYIYLPDQAVLLLGERGDPNDFVFPKQSYDSTVNLVIENWLLRAGIRKKITFHCARHTFAVMQLTLGTDIYTVSKLLGHRNLATTEVYAKIIDQKKKEAVERIPDIL